ncbi:MAG: PEGA domain-containing protein [Myxococcales bacterium]|jgi:hypothetical protein
MRRRSISAAILAIALAAGLNARAEPSPTSAAVVATEATLIPDAVLEQASLSAHESAANSALVMTFEPKAAESALRSSGLNPRSCGASADCIKRLGRALGVRYLIALGIASFAGLSAVKVDIVDTLSGEVVGHKERTGIEAETLAVLPGEMVREALPIALRHKPSELAVTCNVEGAIVYLDGLRAGVTPLSGPIVVLPGDHDVRIEAKGHQPHRASVHVAQGERKAHSATLVPATEGSSFVESEGLASEALAAPAAVTARSASGYRTAAIVTGALALAGLGGGVAFAISMRNDEDAYYAACAYEYDLDCRQIPTLPWRETEELAALRRSADRKGLLATSAFGVAAAAAVTTGVLLLLSPSQPAADDGGIEQLGLVPRPGGFALAASGTF